MKNFQTLSLFLPLLLLFLFLLLVAQPSTRNHRQFEFRRGSTPRKSHRHKSLDLLFFSARKNPPGRKMTHRSNPRSSQLPSNLPANHVIFPLNASITRSRTGNLSKTSRLVHPIPLHPLLVLLSLLFSRFLSIQRMKLSSSR